MEEISVESVDIMTLIQCTRYEERARELWNIVHQPSFRDMEDDIDKSWSRLAAHFEEGRKG